MQDSHEAQFFDSQLPGDIHEPEPAASAEEDSSHAAGSSQPEEDAAESPKRRAHPSPVDFLGLHEPKRVKRVDEEYEPLSSSSSEEGEISAASDNDEPLEASGLFEGKDPEENANLAYEDSAFFDECRKGLIALKSRLTKAMKKDEFDNVYPMYKVDDDFVDDFVSYIAENLIDWQKFEDEITKENKKEEGEEEKSSEDSE